MGKGKSQIGVRENTWIRPGTAKNVMMRELIRPAVCGEDWGLQLGDFTIVVSRTGHCTQHGCTSEERCIQHEPAAVHNRPTNSEGSYECSCSEGYAPHADLDLRVKRTPEISPVPIATGTHHTHIRGRCGKSL
ncbi:unnamed protein product [Boreogadus saida]